MAIMMVIFWSRKARPTVNASSGLGIMMVRLPAIRGSHRQTFSPKEWKMGRLPRMASLRVQPVMEMTEDALQVMLWWESMMPFGIPVEPLEKITTAQRFTSCQLSGEIILVSTGVFSSMVAIFQKNLPGLLFSVFSRSSRKIISGSTWRCCFSTNARLVTMCFIPVLAIMDRMASREAV